jgi:PAS domain S-box-containing protein
MRWRLRVLPQSLIGRVFALYTLALAAFVGTGLALFFRFQFTHELEAALERADGLVSVVAPAISDGAVIGDYDMIQRTLEHAIGRSDFASASFIDLKGGAVNARRSVPPEVQAPTVLVAAVADRLYETNLPIVVGGRDYGVLRLRYAADDIAGGIWQQARVALMLSAGGLALGLLLIWVPLKNWLGNLGRLQSFEAEMQAGAAQQGSTFAADAPIEFQRTFEILSRVAASLHTQREQAAVTLDAVADGVFTLDAVGHVVLANPAACAALRTVPEAVLGRPVREVLPQLFPLGAAFTPWRNRRQQITARDGSARVVDTTLSPITDPHGQLCGHVLACRDVTEQHALDLRLQDELRTRRAALTALRGVLEGMIPQAAGRRGQADDIEAISSMIGQLVQRLQEHSNQLGAIFELSPDGFVSFDDHMTVSYVSPGLTRLTGLDDSEVLGLSEAEFARLVEARCVRHRAAFPDFGSLREARDGAHDARRHFVEVERPARRTLELALRGGNGGPISQVLLLRDVTLEIEVDRLKSDFLSTAAHELRTPMASIYGFSELMMHRKLSPERQQEVISTIHRQAALMTSIVDELLDLARIEARKGKDFVIEELDLQALVGQVVHDFKPPNERASPSLEAVPCALRVHVDGSKLTQALGNVLSNAYKYSPGGGQVHVGFRMDPAASRVGLRVQDHGIGMTPAQLARVCERFYRADASGAIPGTGLGMSIVQEIVQLLGGTLTLASEPGSGTEVTLWLPLAPARPAEAGHSEESALARA